MRTRRGTVIVKLPLDTTIFVQSFTNASLFQRITVQLPTGESRVFQGRGQGNIIGNASFRTPSSFRGLNYFPIAVTVQFFARNRFNRSLVIKNCARMRKVPYKTIGVFSDDFVDRDFTDATITFSFFNRR